MTELEKFKRRLIRMVARLHVQQKKPEDELWEYLRKQTKCDCKWLWERMRALTLKRLKRLLIAEDRQENIPAVARMSLTDWLLFDCILVHEKIDVIGSELMAEGRSSEPRPLFSLFSLVQKYQLEGLRGEELARAWTAATVSYNSGGRQCSPMLLQRRWYQLKEVTRTKFYNFWFSYRGNAKLLTDALKDKPTRLQSAVARRYPHIITTPFLEWEELIEQKLIIMPPEFEIQMKSLSAQLPKPVEDNDADLVLLEPEIETIDLGVDSDSDDELRDEVEGSKAKQMIVDEDISAVQSITLKQEPVDEEEHIEEGIDLDSAHMDAIDAEINHIEGIEALENIDIPIEIDEKPKQNPPEKKKRGRKKKLAAPIEIEDSDSLDNTNSIGYTDEDTIRSVEENMASIQDESIIPESITSVPSTDDAIASSTVDISSTPTVSPTENDIKPEINVIDVPLTSEDVISESMDDETTTNIESSLSDRVPPVADAILKEEPKEVIDTNITDDFDTNMDESPELPQITNVFGNVDIPDEELQKLSNYLEKTRTKIPAPHQQDVEDEIEEDIIKVEVTDSAFATSVEGTCDVQTTSIVEEKNESEIKSSSDALQDNLLDDAIPDMTFEDDGIEFIDDGIVEEQDGENATKGEEHGMKSVKQGQNQISDVEKPSEESKSIDLKLLMVPVVYTRKLEHMDILRNKVISHVKGEDSIELILAESRPVSKKSIEIKEEQRSVGSTMSDDEEDAHDDLFDRPDDAGTANSSDSEDEISEDKKVPITSVLFKKPPNREYGPLVICKNPDFNTRLKRLTVGFLSHSRNRFLLSACKPLTIDLCKAFESKLVDKTVYLKDTPMIKCEVKVEKPDACDENIQSPPIFAQEDLVETDVATTTDSVQNVVNSVLEKALPPALREPNEDIRKEMEDRVDAIIERNKVIVLPNIENVRRINQKLLVAEVSPMRIENTNYVPPVSLVSTSMEKLNLPVTEEPLVAEKPATEIPNVEKAFFKKAGKEMPSGTVICSGQVINNKTTVRNYRGNNTKNKLPWRPEARCRDTRGFWNATNRNKKTKIVFDKRFGEQLLTVDSLNKMLNIVHHKDPIASHGKVSYKSNLKDKQRRELLRKVNEMQRMLTGENSRSDTDETQDVDKQIPGTSKRTPDESKPFDLASSKPKRGRPGMRGGRIRKHQKIDCSDGYGTYCCWIQFKINHPRSLNVHPCDYPCICCCRKGIESETDPSIIKVCQSIESVIEQSREIVENNTSNSKEQTVNNEDNHTVINSTPTNTSISEPNVIDNNVIDITDGDNDTEMDVVVHDININNPNQSDDTNRNYEIVDSKMIGLTEQNTSGKNEDINQVGNASNKVNVNEVAAVAAHITIQSTESQGKATEDCVVIDSDEPETPEKSCPRPPSVKVNVLPNQDTFVKRKRGRPPKYACVPDQISKAPPVRTMNTRFNFRSILKKQNESEKVLFLSSNHMKKSNHPIFLGKNKILLTDVLLPRNKDKPVQVEQSPALINTNLPLPQGVDLMLLPNGVLTCSVDPNAQLNAEEISNLGVIIDSIQSQLSLALKNAADSTMPEGTDVQIPAMQMVSPLQQVAMPTMTLPDIIKNSRVVNVSDDEKDAQPITDNSLAAMSRAEDSERADKVTLVTGNMTTATAETAERVEDTNSAKEYETTATAEITESAVNFNSDTDGGESAGNIHSVTDSVTTATTENDESAGNIDSVKERVTTLTTEIAVSAGNIHSGTESVTPSATESNESAADITSGVESMTPAENMTKISDSAPIAKGNNSYESEKITECIPMKTDETSTVQPSREEPTVTESTDTVPALDTTDNNSALKSNKDNQSTSRDTNINVEQDIEKERRTESEPVNKKTILSDLMEMSGIFEEDIAPIEITPQIPEVPPLVSMAPEPPIVLTPPPLAIPVPNPANALPELTPITSFAELKYACLNNGKFFKLDLDTQSLTPINVCIKKKVNEVQAKQFVDLTDDADEEEKSNEKVTMNPNETIKRTVVATHLGDMPVYVIRKTKAKDPSPTELSQSKRPEPAKPLKLFKVVHPFGPNVIQKSKRAKGNSEDVCLADVAFTKTKRARKQNLAEQAFETPTLNFLTSEEEREHYEFDGSFEDTSGPADDSDSSDDEPLAKKVKRREEALKQAELAKKPSSTVENSEPLAEPAICAVPENAQKELPPQNKRDELPLSANQVDLPSAEIEEPVDEPEMIIEELDESLLGPSELEFMSDHDDEEEDCILGV